jgi:hypothetical protein
LTHSLSAYFFLFLSGACVSADPATLFWLFVDFLFFSILEAFDATSLLVFSFFATCFSPVSVAQRQGYPPRLVSGLGSQLAA